MEKKNTRRGVIAWTIVILVLATGALTSAQIRAGMTWAWKRWQFERAWTTKKVNWEFKNSRFTEAFLVIEKINSNGTALLGDVWATEGRPITFKATGVTLKELTLRVLDSQGYQYLVYSGNVLVIYRPGSTAEREFFQGGLRWGPGSSGVRAALEKEIELEFTQNSAVEVLNYLAYATEVEATGRLPSDYAPPLITARLPRRPAVEAWDLCLRLTGTIGEVHDGVIHVRRVQIENGDALSRGEGRK